MKVYLSLLLLFSLHITTAQNDSGVLKIGEEFDVNISSHENYTTTSTGIVFKKEFRSNNAGYIKVYFENFNIKPGDYVKVYSPALKKAYYFYSTGKVIDANTTISNFWSTTLWDDHIVVELYSVNGNTNYYGFDIKKVAYGYPTDKITEAFEINDSQQESICSLDNKEPVACYSGTEMGRKSQAVCRLLIGGSSVCTGWLLGCDGNLMTNNHCIDDTTTANNTEFVFNFQANNCNGTSFASSDLVATSATLIQTDSNLDFTLLQLPTNPTSTYGYLSLASTPPSVGERIYIPQHPGGRRKEIAVNTDVSGDANGFAQITHAGGLPNRVQYMCDTEGGSSGSPVIRYNDNLVVAIHNTGGCPNGSHGRSDQLIAAIGSNMPACGVDDSNPESPSVGFLNSPLRTNEGTDCNFQDISFNLGIAKAPTQNADVSISSFGSALLGVDYDIITPNPVTFLAGQTNDKTIVVRIYNDAFVENDEDFTLSLAINANGGDATLGNDATFTHIINDDDFNPDAANQESLFYDDFENGLSDWVVSGNGTSNFSIGNATTATSSAWSAAGNTTNFAFVNDDECNCDMSMERLAIGTPLDLSVVSDIELSFKIIYNDSNNQFGSDAFVQTSTDNGQTWQTVGSEIVTFTDWGNMSVDLSPLAGQPNVLISFFYNDLGNWSYGFAIDDVLVTGQGNASIQTSTNSTSGFDNYLLNGMGTSNSYDSNTGNIIASVTNNDSFDYGCINLSVSRSGTSGQPHNNSTAPDLAMDKQFSLSATNTTTNGNVTTTFYFTEAEVSGWETAVANAGGTFSRADLFINRTTASGITENVSAVVSSFNGGITLTGDFTSIEGTYTFAPESVLSVNTNLKDTIGVYPNPFNDIINISTSEDSIITTIKLYDITGKEVKDVKLSANTNSHQINVSKLSNGVYFLKLISSNNNIIDTKKMIKY